MTLDIQTKAPDEFDPIPIHIQDMRIRQRKGQFELADRIIRAQKHLPYHYTKGKPIGPCSMDLGHLDNWHEKNWKERTLMLLLKGRVDAKLWHRAAKLWEDVRYNVCGLKN